MCPRCRAVTLGVVPLPGDPDTGGGSTLREPPDRDEVSLLDEPEDIGADGVPGGEHRRTGELGPGEQDVADVVEQIVAKFADEVDKDSPIGITIPAAFSGVSAAVLLGVGRAVGETMAATVILANVTDFPGPLFDFFDNTITLTSVIANQYGVAQGLHLSALFGAGVVLFVTVLFLSIGSQLIEERMERNLGGNQ